LVRATDALEYMRTDDPIGAVPVHLVCGIWGHRESGPDADQECATQ
jgi:Amt family ammonium transporter